MEDMDITVLLKMLTDPGPELIEAEKEEIFSEENVNLVSMGMRLDQAFYQNLINNKLIKSFDNSRLKEPALSIDSLRDTCKKICEKDDLLSLIEKASYDADRILQVFGKIQLPKILLQKLSLLRQEMPATFIHDIKLAYLSVYIGMELNMDVHELITLACAGLFVDIALLHMDQTLFEDKRKLEHDERKQIYLHPVIAAMILDLFHETKNAAQIVLQHHELLDGSGYPKGIPAKQIDKLSMITGLSELVITMSEEDSERGYSNRLAAILKFNLMLYPRSVTKVISELLHMRDKYSEQDPQSLSRQFYLEKLSILWAILKTWKGMEKSDKKVTAEAVAYLDKNVDRVEHALRMGGLTLSTMEMSEDELDGLLEDGEEILSTLNEGRYQLEKLANELKRRYPNLLLETNSDLAIKHWLDGLHANLERDDATS